MKLSAAISAAAIAAVATAESGAYDTHQGMPQFNNPFPRTSTGSNLHLSPRKSSTLHKSVGARVGPGRVLSKSERLLRKASRVDSVFGGMDGQSDQRVNYDIEHTWAAFKAKWAADPWWSRAFEEVGWDIEHKSAPSAAACSIQDLRTGRRPHSLRSLICLLILFLLVFGSLYTLLEYLLSATRASACSVTTVYLPVTYTVTTGLSSVSPVAASNATSPTLTSTATTTRTSTVVETFTSLLTMLSEGSSVSWPPSASSPSYVYTTNSAGSTEWINGHSPSSGASVIILTTTVVMNPIAPTGPAITMQSTATLTSTITPPAYTSTVYSLSGPDLTSTSTSTHYTTYTVSNLNSSASPTSSRSTFAGVSTSGWNASTSADPAQAANADDPITTTIMAVSYFGTGDDTTSTTTTFITTTVALQYTTTVYPAAQSSSGTPYVTTITALPVTITPDGSGLPTLTSIGNASSSSLVSPLSNTSSANQSSTMKSSHTVTTTLSSAPLLHTSIQSDLSYNSSSMPATVVTSTIGQATPSVNMSQAVTHTSNGTFPAGTMTSTQSLTQPSSSVPSKTPGSSVSPAQISMTMSQHNSTANSTSMASLNSGHSRASSPSAASSSGSNGISAAGISSTASSTETGSQSSRSATISLTRSFHTAGTSQPSTHNISMTASVSSRIISKTTKTKSTPLAASSLSSSSLSGMITTLRSSKSKVSFTTSSFQTSSTTPLSSSASSTASATVNATNPFPASSATATPTAGCGEHGDFVLTFDDLPNFLPTDNNDTTITQAPPIPRPYHHLTFSDGYVYAPEPSEPYQPASPPHLAVFLANATGRVSRFWGKPGEISDGQGRDAISAFWFDAYSAFFGCDNMGTDACTLVMKAYTWDPTTKDEILTYKQNATIPPCKTETQLNCQMQKVDFPSSFRNLTGLQVQAYTGNSQRMFYVDDMALHWSNNTCAAGLLRQSSQ